LRKLAQRGCLPGMQIRECGHRRVAFHVSRPVAERALAFVGDEDIACHDATIAGARRAQAEVDLAGVAVVGRDAAQAACRGNACAFDVEAGTEHGRHRGRLLRVRCREERVQHDGRRIVGKRIAGVRARIGRTPGDVRERADDARIGGVRMHRDPIEPIAVNFGVRLHQHDVPIGVRGQPALDGARVVERAARPDEREPRIAGKLARRCTELPLDLRIDDGDHRIRRVVARRQDAGHASRCRPYVAANRHDDVDNALHGVHRARPIRRASG
jgi:hypothetical protein